MLASVRLFKLFAVISILTLVAAYIFSIVAIDLPWLRDDFLFGIASGISASSIVVVATEMRQYLLKKEEVERAIYVNSASLYSELHAQKQTLSFYLDNDSVGVPGSILECRLGLIDHHRMCIQALEYSTFCRKNKFRQKLDGYKNITMPGLTPHLASCLRLPEAITRTKLDLCKSGQATRQITSSDPPVHTTLVKLKESASTQNKAIDTFLKEMEATWPKRFNWAAEKEAIETFTLSNEAVREAAEEFFGARQRVDAHY